MKYAIPVFVALLLAPPATLHGANAPKPKGKQNIVLFLIDDLGWKDVGCNGSSYYRPPNIGSSRPGMLTFTPRSATAGRRFGGERWFVRKRETSELPMGAFVQSFQYSQVRPEKLVCAVLTSSSFIHPLSQSLRPPDQRPQNVSQSRTIL